MKRILATLTALILLINSAHASPTGSEISISCGLSTPCGAVIASINVYLDNGVWLKSRNAANSADLDLVRADTTDNTEINAGTGKVINVSIAKTPEVQFSGDTITYTGNTGYLGAPTAIAFTGGGAGTPVVTQDVGGLTFASNKNIVMPGYVPTLASTPVTGTNSFQYGVNAVPTNAANNAGLLPPVPTANKPIIVINNGANAIRVKAEGTPGIGTANTAGAYFALAAGQSSYCVAQTSVGPWQCVLGNVPTPAGP